MLDIGTGLRRRWIALVLGSVLVAGACSSGTDDADGDPPAADRAADESDAAPAEDDGSDPDAGNEDGGGSAAGDEGTGEDPPSLSDDEVAARIEDLGGRLAVGNGPELAVVSPDGSSALVLDGSESVVASQPTWSHDGRHLAWSSISARRQVVLTQTFADDGAPDGEPVVSQAAGNPVFYLQWNAADDRLAYIRNAARAGQVEVGVLEPGSPVEPVGQGVPFFISWSPGPDRLLGHRNESSIDSFDPASAEADGFTAVSGVAGGFSAPAWVDAERALVVADGALSYLDVASGEVEPIRAVDGPIRFVLSPDRTKVAYQQLAAAAGGVLEAGLPSGGAAGAAVPTQSDSGSLTVVDLASGQATAVTSARASAWEWSPDSSQLAWLLAEISGGRPVGQWHFWSADGETSQSTQFGLTRKVGQAYLPFFAQYTQSVTRWSPDSTAFAFAGLIGQVRGVWIQLVGERVEPQWIGQGDFVTWAPGDLPDGLGASAA